MTEDLADIIAGCRARDGRAQRRLYERYHRAVYRLAVRLAGRREAADLVQEVFLRVFTRIDAFRGESAFATWLYRVAANECLRHASRRQRSQELIDEPVSADASPDRVLEHADLLEQALGHLEPRLRAVFLLREQEGLSYQAIADALDVPPGTVASQLNRARAELQGYLRRVEQGHHDEL
jgi:RNA polymerase sigma-70 factor (ECF subfamily)